MSDIKNWSNSAGGNTAASPNGFPEGMAPSGVNDSMRETMASVKRWYEDAEWINFNHTPTFVGTGSFLVSAGQSSTATYHAGRRIKVLDGSSTIFGTIHSSTWTASAVYIYSTNDAGANFTASISSISVGILSAVNQSQPDLTVSYAVRAGSASAALNAVFATSASSCTNAVFAASASEVAGISPLTMATCYDEALTFVRGTIDQSGTSLQGSGFTIAYNHNVGGTNSYSVSFSRTFSGTPTVTTQNYVGGAQADIRSVSPTGFTYVYSGATVKTGMIIVGNR